MSNDVISRKEVEEALMPEYNTGQESPQSSSFTGYYRGFSVTFTKRDPKAKIKPLIDDTIVAIDYMVEKSFMPSWNTTTNEAYKTPPVSPQQSTVAKPIVKPIPVAQYDAEQGKKENCKHVHFQYKQSSGHNKPENKDRWYKTCADCKDFLGWQDEEVN